MKKYRSKTMFIFPIINLMIQQRQTRKRKNYLLLCLK